MKRKKKKQKRLIILSSVSAFLVVSTAVFAPLAAIIWVPQQQFKSVLEQNKLLFNNSLSDPIQQIDYYGKMKQSALNSNNLTLFIGYDGCRADAITFVKSKPNGVVFSNDMTNHYISNSINKDTVSGPGWISIFTGKWSSETGDKTSGAQSLNPGIHTLQYEMATDEIKTCFYGWRDTAWTTDFESIPSEKRQYLEYNINPLPDQELVDKTIESINKGTKFISCLLNDVDSAGHANGHLPSNPKYIAAIDESEDYARKIIDAAKEQCKGDRRLNIIISTDHGGRYNGHGGTWLESRTTWFADNFDNHY